MMLVLLHHLMANLDAIILWGLVAMAVMTTILQGSQGLGLSRLSLPFLFGTFVTGNRGRAVLVGSLLCLLGGWAFAVLYFFIFASIGLRSWWVGALVGALHGLFLLVSLPAMAQLHPRMASEYDAPVRLIYRGDFSLPDSALFHTTESSKDHCLSISIGRPNATKTVPATPPAASQQKEMVRVGTTLERQDQRIMVAAQPTLWPAMSFEIGICERLGGEILWADSVEVELRNPRIVG